MCGIVGYIGNQDAVEIVLDGLRRLEYRGYDSAGISTLSGGVVDTRRAEGKLANLQRQLQQQPLRGSIGIGHTRWATHGKPSQQNAHPHRAGGFVVVHNGIIENYLQLKQQLSADGHNFKSETDSEIIAHLIEDYYKQHNDFEQAVRQALQLLSGAFAIAVICEHHPDTLIAAKAGSPLVIGCGDDEFFVASDIPAMLSHTREMIFLDDGEMVVCRGGAMVITTIDGQTVEKQSKTITWDPMMAEKGGYRHFMLKEIHEQPRAVADTIAGRIDEDKQRVLLHDINLSDAELAAFERLYIVACGTSWHAALVGKFMLESFARLPVEVDIASEFRYRSPLVNQRTLTVVISQSGETADTLAALREAHRLGGKVLAVCNVIEASIARESDGVIYTHAGPEIGVASTKAFTTQLVALYLFALHLGRVRGTLSADAIAGQIAQLLTLPRKLEQTLELDAIIEGEARHYFHAADFLYLGRGNQYPIALEGALKLKEISYIHAEGYPAGEMKHGPIALIDENLPVVVIAPYNETYEKVMSNLEEVKARGGRIIVVNTTAAQSEADGAAEEVTVFTLPAICDELMPVLTAVPLQLLAYHIAVLKGTDVDQPRNLAKSVTVE